MEKSGERQGQVAAASGCLLTFAAAWSGFIVWFYSAGPGWRGDFEGQRDWSLIYIELPCMLVGFPLITLLTWSWARALLRGRAGRAMRNVLSGVMVGVTLVLLASVSHMWLTHRIDSLTWLQQGE